MNLRDESEGLGVGVLVGLGFILVFWGGYDYYGYG